MNPLFIALLSFVAAFGGVFALLHSRRRTGLQARLDRLAGRPAAAAPPLPETERGLRPDPLPTVTRWLSAQEFEPRLRLAMLQADLRLRPAEWLALCAGLTVAGFLCGLLVSGRLVPALGLAALGPLGASLALQGRRQARLRRCETQLPDALMLLSSALRAGLSFSAAMQTAADELPPPLAAEFAWASGEAALGVPLETALRRVLARVPSPDLDLVGTAILIQLPLGGNLAEVLDAIADTIRERVRVTGEVQTLTAEGRLSAVILIVLAPALALILTLKSPEYFGPLLQSPFGHWLIGGAVAGQGVGALLIRRMTALEI